MIYGSRVRKLREEQSLSRQDLAALVCVSAATISNWENGRSNPTNTNLDILAIVLNTTTDYLTGLTDEPSPADPTPSETISSPVDSVQVIPVDTQTNYCENCGKPVPEGYRCCQECRWKNRWSETLLNSPELESRRKRSHSTQLFSLDREKPEAIFGASSARNGTKYFTTLETCTCHDFALNHRKIPCKHILRLAGELGLFQSEYFAEDEDDYMMHVVTENPDDASESYQNKVVEMTEIPPEIHEPVKYLPAVVTEPENIPHKPGIFLRLLKYAVCCVFGAVALLFIYGTFVDGSKSPDLYCFPLAFVIAGTLTAMTANRKGEKSAFKWWLYGAVVPIMSWIEVTMLKSENKAKSFMEGIMYSLAGFVVFVIVSMQFRPPVKLTESTLLEARPVAEVVSVPVSEDVKPEPKVSTDAGLNAEQAAYIAKLREQEREAQFRQEHGEWDVESESEELGESEQEAEKERQVQEYLKKANTVVVTSKGKKYHEANCRTVKGSSRTMTIAQAKKRGYTPCKVCSPPSSPVTAENIYWGDNVYTKKSVLNVD